MRVRCGAVILGEETVRGDRTSSVDVDPPSLVVVQVMKLLEDAARGKEGMDHDTQLREPS